MAVLEFSRTRNITPVAGAVRSKVGVKPEYRAAIPSVWIQDYNHHVLWWRWLWWWSTLLLQSNQFKHRWWHGNKILNLQDILANDCATTTMQQKLGCCCKDTRGLLQKLLSFRYQKPNQIPIEGTVSNPEFEPNQISEPEPDENRSSFDLREVD